jgi:hypothetical protein
LCAHTAHAAASPAHARRLRSPPRVSSLFSRIVTPLSLRFAYGRCR